MEKVSTSSLVFLAVQFCSSSRFFLQVDEMVAFRSLVKFIASNEFRLHFGGLLCSSCAVEWISLVSLQWLWTWVRDDFANGCKERVVGKTWWFGWLCFGWGEHGFFLNMSFCGRALCIANRKWLPRPMTNAMTWTNDIINKIARIFYSAHTWWFQAKDMFTLHSNQELTSLDFGDSS